MPRTLHVAHNDELHEVTDVQAVRRRIESRVERRLFAAEDRAHLFLVCYLSDQTALFEQIKYVFHLPVPLSFVRQRGIQKALCQMKIWQRAKIRGTTSVRRRLTADGLSLIHI